MTEMKTRDDLIEYIKGFKRNSGEYTDSEVILIGQKMHLLPVTQRN